MAKKMFTCLAIIILSLCCSVCFASENGGSNSSENSNVNLGEEITDSLNKTGESIRNITDDAMNAGRNDSNNNNNFRTNNSGTNYNATRTSVDDSIATGTTNLSTTTWIWIIMAVVAIIIVAMVWYYAVQDNTKD